MDTHIAQKLAKSWRPAYGKVWYCGCNRLGLEATHKCQKYFLSLNVCKSSELFLFKILVFGRFFVWKSQLQRVVLKSGLKKPEKQPSWFINCLQVFFESIHTLNKRVWIDSNLRVWINSIKGYGLTQNWAKIPLKRNLPPSVNRSVKPC